MGRALTATPRWTAWTAASVIFLGFYTLVLRGFPPDEHVSINNRGGHLSVQVLEAHIRFAQAILPRIPAGAAAYWDHCGDSDLGIDPVFINEDRARVLVQGAYARALSRERFYNPGVPDLDLMYGLGGSGDRPCGITSEFFTLAVRGFEEALAQHRASQALRVVLALLAACGAFVALIRLSQISVRPPAIDDDPAVDPASEKMRLMNRSLGIGGAAALVLFVGVWAYASFCDSSEVEGRALVFWRTVAPMLGLGAAILAGLSARAYRVVQAFTSADPELFAPTASELARTNETALVAQRRAQFAEATRYLEALESNAAPVAEVEAARARLASAEAAMGVSATEAPKRIAALLEDIELRRRDLLSLRANGASPGTSAHAASALRDLREKLATLVGSPNTASQKRPDPPVEVPSAGPSAFSSLSQWTVPAVMALLLFLALLVWSSTRGTPPGDGTDADGVPATVGAVPPPPPRTPAPSPAPATPPPVAPVPPPPRPPVQTILMAPAPAAERASGGERLTPTSVAASSFIRGAGRRHGPERAFDGDPVTAWNESEPGAGAGSWLSATFARPVTVQQLRITTGWDTISPRSGDLFAQNSHLRRVRITFDGGRAIERDVGVAERILVVGSLSERAETVRIEALDVWPGTRWADLCISEIVIEGSSAPSSEGPVGARRHPHRPSRTPAAARQW